MRLFLASLLALLTLSASAQVILETRGQAETVARRLAIDEAMTDLRGQVEALRVTESMSLTAWLASRPVESTAVEQAIRDAAVILDGGDGGQWHFAAEITVGEVNEALRPPSHRRVREPATLKLTGVGDAPIPLVGSPIDTAGSGPVNSTQDIP